MTGTGAVVRSARGLVDLRRALLRGESVTDLACSGDVDGALEGVRHGGRGGEMGHDPVRRFQLVDLVQQLPVQFFDAVLAFDLLLEQHVLEEHGPLPDGAPQAELHLLEVDRLDQEIDHPVAQGVDRGVQRGVAGHHDDRQGVVRQVDAFGQVQAVHARHVDVGEAAIDAAAMQDIQGLGPVAGRHHLIAAAPEVLSDDRPDAFFVIDN